MVIYIFDTLTISFSFVYKLNIGKAISYIKLTDTLETLIISSGVDIYMINL